MKKGKKIILIILSAALVLVLAFVGYVYYSFEGSIIKKIIVKNKVEDYVAENFPDKNYVVGECVYDFKIGNYYCGISSDENVDIRFDAWENSDGRILTDYQNRILHKENIIARISSEMNTYVEKVYKENFSYRNSLLLFDFNDEFSESARESLEFGMAVDPENLPCTATFSFWIETQNDKPTVEELAERLKEIEAVISEKVPCINTYSAFLQSKYTLDEDGEYVPTDYISGYTVYGIPKEVIKGDGLVDYLNQKLIEQENEK